MFMNPTTQTIELRKGTLRTSYTTVRSTGTAWDATGRAMTLQAGKLEIAALLSDGWRVVG